MSDLYAGIEAAMQSGQIPEDKATYFDCMGAEEAAALERRPALMAASKSAESAGFSVGELPLYAVAYSGCIACCLQCSHCSSDKSGLAAS